MSSIAWTRAVLGAALLFLGVGAACTALVGVEDFLSGEEGVPEGGTDTSNAGGGCLIAGTPYASGAPDPNNPCRACKPAVSGSGWTSISDGTGCGNGQVCAAGKCGAQCLIGGTVYATGMPNPSNGCQSCQPGTSTTAWTDLASGTSCGSGRVCSAAVCFAGCFIDGATRGAGAVNPSDRCQSCQPSASTRSWTGTSEDGATCGTGRVCRAGTCIAGCLIEGAVRAAGDKTANGCRSCKPETSTTTWTNLTAGSACGAGGICGAGVCTVTFDHTGGTQTFAVPAGVYSLSLTASGAAGGGGGAGGLGGAASGVLSVTPGDTLTVEVGGTGASPAGGYNGGGAAASAGYGWGGGGASDVRRGGASVAFRVLVGAGGGGAGQRCTSDGGGGGGGAGGAAIGANGNDAGLGGNAAGGQGGTQDAGGGGGKGNLGSGASGGLGYGGGGGGCGGGGGGGYLGGGGGGCASSPVLQVGSGGGGGSCYASMVGATLTRGTRTGHGQVVVSY